MSSRNQSELERKPFGIMSWESKRNPVSKHLENISGHHNDTAEITETSSLRISLQQNRKMQDLPSIVLDLSHAALHIRPHVCHEDVEPRAPRHEHRKRAEGPWKPSTAATVLTHI